MLFEWWYTWAFSFSVEWLTFWRKYCGINSSRVFQGPNTGSCGGRNASKSPSMRPPDNISFIPVLNSLLCFSNPWIDSPFTASSRVRSQWESLPWLPAEITSSTAVGLAGPISNRLSICSVPGLSLYYAQLQLRGNYPLGYLYSAYYQGC